MSTLTDPNADEKYAPHTGVTHEIDDLEKSFAAPASTESGSQRMADNKQLEDAHAAPASTESGSNKLADAKELDQKENEAADDTVGSGFKKGKKSVKGRWLTKKRAKIAGGVAGIGVGGGILGFTFLAGPLEFVHIAETLHASHISQQENAGDGRMGKLYRYLRSGGKVGETRLGGLASRYHGRIISKLAAVGITPEYNKGSIYKGFAVDTTREGPYKGMTAEQAAAAFQEKTGAKVSIEGNVVRVDADGFWKQRKTLRAALSLTGDSKVTTAVRSRVLAKYGFVTWHPLKILDKKVYNTSGKLFTAYKEKWNSRLRNGVEPNPTIDKSKAKEQNGTASKDNPPTDISGPNETVTTDTTKSTLSQVAGSKSLKVAGGLAAVTGLVCLARTVDDKLPEIRYAQVIVPLIRIGLDAISVGEQIKSGQDVDPAELSYLSQSFNNIESKTGKTTDNWNDARSVRAETGQNGGIDSAADNGTKELITQGNPAYLSWTQDSLVTALCSDVGQVVSTGISIIVGVISGGTVSTATSFIASALILPGVIDKVSHIIAGEAVNVAAKGAEWGSNIDYGARLGANAASVPFGGTALSKTQTAQLNTDTQKAQQDDFHASSFFARTFDPFNYKSLTAHLADSLSTSFSTNTMSLINSVTGSATNVMKLPFQLYSSTVHADAPPQPYDYGFPQYGFSEEDLHNANVTDPYANAEDVGHFLDANCVKQDQTVDQTCSPIAKVSKCFGVNITKGDEGWDAVPNNDVNLYDSTNYSPSDCADSGNTDWLKLRFFVMDTGVMEGFACASLDDPTSCANDGVSTQSGMAPASTKTHAPASPIALVNTNTTQGRTDEKRLTATGRATG